MLPARSSQLSPGVVAAIVAGAILGCLGPGATIPASARAPRATGQKARGRAAKKGPSLERSKLLWATVDICNTPRYPHTIGIRGSMPGTRRHGEQMYMRFQVQYQSPSDHQWRDIPRNGDSSFIHVGSARYRSLQAGHSFQLAAAPAGGSYLLRGVVSFQWRRNGHPARSAQRDTTAGHHHVAGADPSGFSAATCAVR